MPSLDANAVANIPNLFQPHSACLPVIDPILKHFGRVWINLRFVEHTGAVRRWICRDAHQPSLCMLFQRGRCAAGANCNQAHVNVDYMAALRELLLSQPYTNCCFHHGELASRREAFRTMLQHRVVEMKYGESRIIPIPPECIAMTAFWDRHIKADRCGAESDQLFRFPWRRVCRLHQSDCCRYGVDCNNIHLCREFCRAQQVGLDQDEGVDDSTEEVSAKSRSLYSSTPSPPASSGCASSDPATPTSGPADPISPIATVTPVVGPLSWQVRPRAVPTPTPALWSVISASLPATAEVIAPSANSPPPSPCDNASNQQPPSSAEQQHQQHLLANPLEELLSFWPALAPALRCATVAASQPMSVGPLPPKPILAPAGDASTPPPQPKDLQRLPVRQTSPPQAVLSPSASACVAAIAPPLMHLEEQLIREALAAQHMRDLVELGFSLWLEIPSPLLSVDHPAPPPVLG